MEETKHIETSGTKPLEPMDDVTVNNLATTGDLASVSEGEFGLVKSLYSFQFKDERLDSMIFVPGASLTPEGIWISPLCIFSDLLRVQGIPSKNLKVAMATLLTCNSAHTGNPLAEEITESGETGALSLLKACLNLTPPKYTIQLPKFSTEIMIREKDQLKFRTIIGFDGEGYRKENQLLNLFLQLQSLKNQETMDTKYNRIFQEVTIEGPTSLVVINKDPTLPILMNPAFLHFHVDSEAKVTDQTIFLGKKFERETHFAWVRASLERLEYRPVKIPFMEQVTRCLIDHKVKYAQQKAETLSKMLSIVAAINNPPPLWKSEIYGKLFGNDIGRTLSKNTQPDHPQSEHLVATKVDYFFLWSFMDGLWGTGDTMTDRQLKIFDAVKNLNCEPTKGKFLDTGDSTKLLFYIAKTETCWATMERIFGYLNKGGVEEISTTTLYRELRTLTQKEVISTRKDPRDKNRALFAICTLNVGGKLRLLHPSKISDGIFDDRPVKVFNPVTGTVETI